MELCSHTLRPHDDGYTTYKTGGKVIDVSTGKPSTPFDHGAGHVDPVSPGLVHDITADDFLSFLCALNYASVQIRTIAKINFKCDSNKKYSVTDLNYPTFSIHLKGATGKSSVVKYRRMLTNVGFPATYKVSVSSETKTESVKISVVPKSLTFRKPNEKKTYTVTFTTSSMQSETEIYACLE